MTLQDSDKLKQERSTIHAALENVDPWSEDDESRPGGQVLSGWVVIAEFMDDVGDRWLSHFSGDATASKGLSSWAVQGFCHDVLTREAAK